MKQSLGKVGFIPYPSSVREMLAVERAWVGAMIDGEGSFVIYVPSSRRYPTPCARLSLGNQRLEIISGLLRATGVGSIGYVKPKSPTHGDFWDWVVSRQNDMLDIARQIREFSEKAQQFLEDYPKVFLRLREKAGR